MTLLRVPGGLTGHVLSEVMLDPAIAAVRLVSSREERRLAAVIREQLAWEPAPQTWQEPHGMTLE